MRIMTAVFLTACAAAVFGWKLNGVVHAGGDPNPRFHVFSAENIGTGLSDDFQVSAIHDTLTGNEIVCVVNLYRYSTSCFQTGRNWR